MSTIKDLIREMMDEQTGEGGGFDDENLYEEDVVFMQMVIKGMTNIKGQLRRIEEKLDFLLAANPSYNPPEELSMIVERCGTLVELGMSEMESPETEDLFIILDFEIGDTEAEEAV